MNIRISKNLFFVLIVFVLLAGCNFPGEVSPSGASLSIIEPSDGARYQVGELVKIRSQVQAPDGAAELTVLVNGQPVRIDRPDILLQSGSMLQPWQPSEPGTYTIQTRMTTASGAALESGTVTIEVGAADSTSVTPTATTGAASITPSPSPTLGPPIATADQNANCRLGPGQAYPVTGELLTGRSSPIVGRNIDSSWWVIQASYDNGGPCWISDAVVIVSGDISAVPIVAAPPLPPSAPALISPSGSIACTSSVILTWNSVDHPSGIARYEWEVKSSGGNDTGTSTETTVEYIVSCATSYQWHVRAVGNDGTVGQYSDYVEFEIQ